MKTVRAEDVRIPRVIRDAVAAHEEVMVVNRDRPAFLIVNPEDFKRQDRARRGRPLPEALAILSLAPLPDRDFARDMERVREAVGPMPADPWAPS